MGVTGRTEEECTFYRSLAEILKRNLKCCNELSCLVSAFKITPRMQQEAAKARKLPPAGWGPQVWALLHELANNYYSKERMAAFHTLLNTLHTVLPCAECADRFKDLSRSNMFLILEKTIPYPRFMQLIHQRVNQTARIKLAPHHNQIPQPITPYMHQKGTKKVGNGIYKFPGRGGLWKPPSRSSCGCG